jgi:hypothetical protein
MRADGDYRPDVEVKREMLRGIQGQGYDVRLVVDDRPSVIEMWKAEGLTVLEVDSGEWEGTPNVEPGHLTMMVGPSGAGKSHFIRNTFGATVVVSSDGLRAEITGDRRDQSKNDQVFAALHAIVKARITNGLDTVVDATNLRSKDRRAIRDLVPQNTKISYIVIDRPLEEKLRDAGWRTEVRIPTKDGGAIGLIEKHHQSFQSAAKEILAGDHDPRVRVHNFIKFGSGNMGGTL